MEDNLFTDIFGDEIPDSQPISLSFSSNFNSQQVASEIEEDRSPKVRPSKCTGQHGNFRSVHEIDPKYRDVFSYSFFNLVQSSVIEDALYSDKSMVVCAPTGSGKTVIFEMAIVQLLMDIDDRNYTGDFKIIYMAPVKALCTERLTEWYPKFTKLGLLCIEVTGDTDVDFNQLKPYRIIITTPEKWDMLTRRWRDHSGLVEVIKLFLIDEVHILNDEVRGPVLEAVVSRMKTIESSAQSSYRIGQLKKKYNSNQEYASLNAADEITPPRIRFVAISATVSNPEDVAAWLGTNDKPAVFYRFGDECRPVKLKRIVEGYPCPDGTSIFKFDIILNYKLWPIIQKYHDGKPTLIFCNTRKSVILTAETLSREITINFNPEQRAKLTTLASNIKNKKLQSLILAGVSYHHAGLLFEERMNIERAFRNRDLPILITTTTLAMGVNLPAHLVIIKNTQQYVNGAYQEYSISTVLQMVGRAGRPQYDTEATAVIMTRLTDKPRYQALVGGSEPLQSYLHKRLAENLNSEAALGTVTDVAQCVQWLRSTFLYVRAARDPRRYLALPTNAQTSLISKKIEELCVRAMNGLASAGLITMDEASCIQSTEAGRLMSVFYLDLETMKHIMKIEGSESLERLLWLVCESHELADMHLRVDERRCLNALNRNNTAATIRFPMKGKINTRQMKLNCIIQAILGCLPIPDPSLHQEAMKVMRIADRVCKCLVTYVTRPDLISQNPKFLAAVINSVVLAKCIAAHLWENSPYVSKQLKGIGPTFSTLLASAGKTNFMLLEESHPRDLERIMNKGPPAGNVLRKQISLLPKYNIKMIPIDEKIVAIQIELLNQSYLSQNIEHLTAGDSHKSYIIVGDSENNILLLTTFKDKDLIGVYDGNIVYNITRKHNYEHKIIVNCISSNFVGIDVQSEYLFKDLEYTQKQASNYAANRNIKTTPKNVLITDAFKQRKRKTNAETDIAVSKEKKKRQCAVAERLRILKESLDITSEGIKNDLQKSEEISNNILNNLNLKRNESHTTKNTSGINVNDDTYNNEIPIIENEIQETDEDDLQHNVEIDNILNEIEKEISTMPSNKPKTTLDCNSSNIKSYSTNSTEPMHDTYKAKKLKNNLNTKLHQNRKKMNYSFIDLLEKNQNLSDDDEEDNHSNDNTFSNTIKLQLDTYLQNMKKSINESKPSNIEVNELINGRTNKISNHCNGDSFTNSKVIDKKESDLMEVKVNLLSDSTGNDKVDTFTVSTIDNNSNSQNTNGKQCLLSKTKYDEDKEMKQNEYGSMECNSLMLIESNKIQTTNENKPIILSKKLDSQLILLPLIPNLNKSITPNTFLNKPIAIVEFDQKREKMTVNDPITPIMVKAFNGNSSKLNNSEMKNDTQFGGRCINHYSYTASKINVSTHNRDNRKVCVIKKLKIDLDIKEMLSDTDDKFDTHNFDINNETGKGNRIEITIPNSMQTTENCHDKILHYFENKSKSKENYNEDERNIENKQKYTKVNFTCDTKLENILQRYSTVLRKSDCDTPITQKETANPTLPNATYNPKNKRPFKITEISRINVPLPDVVIESTKTETPMSQSMKIKAVCKIIPDITDHATENIANEVPFKNPPQSPDPDILDNKPFDVQEGLIEDIEDLTLHDFKIEQTMLDPKTILQCLNEQDTELVIPPPPEFCDVSYSPEHFQKTFNNNFVMDVIDQNFIISNKKVLSNELSELNHNHDFIDINTMSPNSVKSYIITKETPESCLEYWKMHRNANDKNDVVNFANRHSKLNQFKCTQKIKFKRKCN